MAKNKSRNRQHTKRHGHHHRKTKSYVKTYAPYIPAVLILIASLLLSGVRTLPSQGVLAYATNVSSSGLLSSTNSKRSQNGVAALEANSQLSSAAQAKANDMVERDYWSHTTPEGDDPWIFMDAVGYDYQKAGENLAYGFTTNSETVTGWMNSPSHKANMLDSSFTEVGFGYANSENYQGSGPQTVVVAMYGKPQVLASGSSQPVPTEPTPAESEPTPSQEPVASPQSTETNEPGASEAKPTEENTVTVAAPTNTDNPVPEAGQNPKAISRIEALTSSAGWAVFAVGIMSGVAATWLLANHALRLRHFIKQGERFILHHPVLDVTLISLMVLGYVLSQTVGVIL